MFKFKIRNDDEYQEYASSKYIYKNCWLACRKSKIIKWFKF